MNRREGHLINEDEPSDIFDTDSSDDDDEIRLTEFIDEEIKQKIVTIKDQDIKSKVQIQEDQYKEEMGGILVYDSYSKLVGCTKIEQYF